jgi:hypothetical protein
MNTWKTNVFPDGNLDLVSHTVVLLQKELTDSQLFKKFTEFYIAPRLFTAFKRSCFLSPFLTQFRPVSASYPIFRLHFNTDPLSTTRFRSRFFPSGFKFKTHACTDGLPISNSPIWLPKNKNWRLLRIKTPPMMQISPDLHFFFLLSSNIYRSTAFPETNILYFIWNLRNQVSCRPQIPENIIVSYILTLCCCVAIGKILRRTVGSIPQTCLLLITSWKKNCIISAVSKYFNSATFSKDLRAYRACHRTIFNLTFQCSQLRCALQLLIEFWLLRYNSTKYLPSLI